MEQVKALVALQAFGIVDPIFADADAAVVLPLVRNLPAHADVLRPRTAGQDLDHQFRRSVVVHMERAGRIQIRLRFPVDQDARPRVFQGSVMPLERPGVEQGVNLCDRTRATDRAQVIAQAIHQGIRRRVMDQAGGQGRGLYGIQFGVGIAQMRGRPRRNERRRGHFHLRRRGDQSHETNLGNGTANPKIAQPPLQVNARTPRLCGALRPSQSQAPRQRSRRLGQPAQPAVILPRSEVLAQLPADGPP